MTVAPYPEEASARRRWIEQPRGPRNVRDPWRPHAFFLEKERSESGAIIGVATVLLTNRECPWRCVMCDLWQNTLTETVPTGAIPAQIDYALGCLCQYLGLTPLKGSVPGKLHSWQIKLYNSGSFFDERAIPAADYREIAQCVSGFQRVIVECHPKLVGESVLRFRDLIGTELEVAMGLETANADTLAKLNKGMTLEDFASAADFLVTNGVNVRAFILLKPPFTGEAEGIAWAKRSIGFAFDCGVEVACVIPTRPGNGAMEALATRGEFSPPRLGSLEAVLDYGVALKRGRVFADLWDVGRFSDCADCFNTRKQRLEATNLSQQAQPAVICPRCER
jgi:radical SAM enzyme (TIGR01210 family)